MRIFLLLLLACLVYGGWAFNGWQEDMRQQTKVSLQELYQKAYAEGYRGALIDVIIICREQKVLRFADLQFACSEMKKL